MSIQNNATDDRDGPATPYLPSLGRLVGFASKGANDIAAKRLARHGLTLKQWIVLSMLWREDGLTIGQIAVYYKATEPSTSSLIDRMEKKGLLERRHDTEDRRQVRVYISAQGRALSHLLDFYTEVNDALLQGFNKKDRETLFALLERVVANAEADLLEARD